MAWIGDLLRSWRTYYIKNDRSGGEKFGQRAGGRGLMIIPQIPDIVIVATTRFYNAWMLTIDKHLGVWGG